MRKDIKKSSYYVFYLGAQEARGLRGTDHVAPIIRSLVEREKEVEPFKVTLQTSYKGLKIIQNVPSSPAEPELTPNKHPPKSLGTSVVKHFIPHHSVTYVHREEDIVATILVWHKYVDKTPVHVHVYRCDSVETADILSRQLQTIIDRPENQKKLADIEERLTAKGLLGIVPSQSRRLIRTREKRSTRESESSGGSLSDKSGNQERIASLYDSLAAELREKLASGPQPQAPILLPPRDYDTVHRQKGDLSNIDNRRCLNANVVGVNVHKGSASGNKESPLRLRGKVGSSGGSSGIGSDHAPSPEHEQESRFLEEQSSSDEEWNLEPSKDSLLMPTSQKRWSKGEVSLPRPRRGLESTPSGPSPVSSGAYKRRTSPAVDDGMTNSKSDLSEEPPVPSQRWRRSAEERQRSPSPTQRSGSSVSNSLSPRERFHDAKEKFLLLERDEQERVMKMKLERRKQENITPKPQLSRSWSQGRSPVSDELSRPFYSPQEEVEFKEQRFVQQSKTPPYRRIRTPEEEQRPERDFPREEGLIDNVERTRLQMSPQGRHHDDYPHKPHLMYGMPSRREMGEQRGGRYENRPTQLSGFHHYQKDIIDELGARAQGRSVDYTEQEMSAIPLERYRSPPRMSPPPSAAPRHFYPQNNEEDFRDMKNRDLPEPQGYPRHPRRSAYETIEDERKRNSSELAKEFKRRSYQDPPFDGPPSYLDCDYGYPGRDPKEEIGGRFRHSFVEPLNHPHDHLQRTRVGIAAIHPY